MRHPASPRPAPRTSPLPRRIAGLLAVALLLAGCDAAPAITPAVASGAPSPVAGQSQQPPASTDSPAATEPPAASATEPATASPSTSPAAMPVLVPGSLGVTVVDRVRVRTRPVVADDSIKLAPLLPKGTQLLVLDGPVEGSGYAWYHVAPVGLTMRTAQSGWVAVADHDGTPWVQPSETADTGFRLAVSQTARSNPSKRLANRAATSLNAFGIDLYRTLAVAKGNRDTGLVISPDSIATALAMARAGAKGTTGEEMDAVLHTAGWESLSAGLSSLDQLLATYNATWKDSGDQHRLDLRTANMAFGQQDYPISQAFLDRLARTFGSGFGLVDYINATEDARAAINGWVKLQTLGRIPELLTPPNVTSYTRLVLVNAMYLKAEWVNPFDVDSTRARAFTTSAGGRVKVPTMLSRGGSWMPLASGSGWKATELYLAGKDYTTPLSLTLVLPDNLASFEKALKPATLAAIDKDLAAERTRLEKVTYKDGGEPSEMDCGTYPYQLSLYLPRFGIDSRQDLGKSLAALGMRVAFTEEADFSGITPDDPLHIGMVVHQANIDVDEKGLEASAATAVGVDTTGGCGQPQPRVQKTLRLDRPFMFFLRDVATGAVLFMGRVADPTIR